MFENFFFIADKPIGFRRRGQIGRPGLPCARPTGSE
jgi:hypothetical protein